MKKKMLSLLLLLSTCAFAQNFAPIGSTWYFNRSTVNPDYKTYKKFESIKDTTINGQNCMKIVESIENTLYEIQYMFSRNDSVFFWAENEFHLLYDFNAEKGETVILDYFKKSNGESLDMVIDSTIMTEINGISRKIQYITCGDGLSIEFPGPIIQGIGSAYYMFPTFDNAMNGSLRCYQDNSLGLYKNPYYAGGWNKECDYITTGTNEIKADKDFVIVPNPVNSTFKVSNLNSSSNFKIIDLNGKTLLEGNLKPNEEINLSSIDKGVYFIQFESENKLITKKILRE